MTLQSPQGKFVVRSQPPVSASSPGARTRAGTEPLRICSILTSLTSGGAEILITNLNEAYAGLGARACITALCDAQTLGNSQAMETELQQRIAKAGAHFDSLALTRRRGLIEGVRALRRHLHETRPHIVHAHTVRAVLMLAFSGFGGPIVFTHHNSRLSFPPAAFRFLDHVVAHYVAISNETASLYRDLSRRPFSLIPNAPAASYRAKAPRENVGTPCRILTVGAISEQKNYDLLIEVARVLRQYRPGTEPVFCLRVAGGGTDLERLRGKVDALGLADMVQFLGERADIRDLLAASDIYLNTSRYEGASIAIHEAMSMGLPVVASDVNGNRGLVVPGRNGALCALDKPTSFANAIARLAHNAYYYHSYSQGALATSQSYSLEGSAQRHFDLYKSLLRSGPAHKD
ncbi:glycosyltransferase [Novosphingobium mangrovi (ex Hu et al. 2023)]|uniref:Glycosyltransferase n=1 Tax=Novosphingobium mangrovi (ex Hu et al. 2023) TaxID=2930094 RepID=A0ABT0ABX9_9SPHN|nr:glycosyltransferase [Novosphingobium mangrovi (ex Hu et al. 2023)]MCJ1960705.1 glycosyltransferase [Novosphingobium mangrovi (ex Hu et al. 2023)]